MLKCLRAQITPASSECPQLWLVVCVQLVRVDSVPVQWTSSMTILPVPWPKYALPTAVPIQGNDEISPL